MKPTLLVCLIGCGVAALLALGLLFFPGALDHSRGKDRVEPPPPRDVVVRDRGQPAGVPDRDTGAPPVEVGIGQETVSAEAVQSRVAELKDTARPLAEREAAVASLGRKGDAGSVAVLMALGNERAYLNSAAVEALGAVRSAELRPGVEKYMAAKLEHDDSQLACAAARSLARLKGAAAVPELAAALVRNRQRADGHQEIVCSAIVKALEEICSPAAVPALSGELARSEERGWSLEYGSRIVGALRQMRTPEGGAATSAYAGRLEARKPADPLARRYFEEKIAEARSAVAPAAAKQEKAPGPPE
jgi:HEAT repeat protein